jgi:hypothetical protein
MRTSGHMQRYRMSSVGVFPRRTGLVTFRFSGPGLYALLTKVSGCHATFGSRAVTSALIVRDYTLT